ncbi:MAG: HlyD family type I secretion periplasmic adaptor subunit [Hyphomicrobiales bacterium]
MSAANHQNRQEGTARPEPLPFPRRCDGIAREAHGTFLYSVTAGVLAFLLWGSITEIDQVTRGSGRVVPQTQNQLVQHLEGGIVTEIVVREGDFVEKGATMMRIDNLFSRAELAKTRLDIKAKRIRLARLDAEIKGLPAIELTPELAVDIPDILERETALFGRRQDSLKEQQAILDDQVRQKELELSELKSRWTNTARERELVAERVASLRRLAKKGAVSTNELLENERALQQVETKISDLLHDIPRTEAALSEVQRRRNESTLQFRSDAEQERTETALEIAKLEATSAAMQDRSQRSEVVAPISGIVNKVFVTTIGGVVKSGEPLVQIVPADSSISVEARLSPADRAEVWPGLPAMIKISAYEYSIYGALEGRITDISPDALQDERGEPYFRVRLEAGAMDFGPQNPVVPGMLADVDIMTGRHTILAYLLKPIRNLRDNALRQ